MRAIPSSGRFGLPTRAIGMTKRLFEHAYNATLEAQLELEAELQQAATGTADFAEGAKSQFDVLSDGELVFSKQREKRFPEENEVLDLLASSR